MSPQSHRKPPSRKQAVALTIGGSDSGGGAGIQADLKTFAALDVHGTSAITCVTAQNPRRVLGIHPCPPQFVLRQIEAVFDELHPAAVKTGMLHSAAIVRVVAGFFKSGNRPPLVVDPVMVSTSGARLLQAPAVRALKRELLPRAALVTPNVAEAEVLLGRRIRSVEDLRAAANEICRSFGCPALVKGGHLQDGREAIDILADGRGEWMFRAPFIAGVRTHGTGCTVSAAIAACLATGKPLVESIRLAKEYVSSAIARHRRVGRFATLNHSRA